MKKAAAFFLMLAMLVSFTACGTKNNTAVESETQTTEESESQTTEESVTIEEIGSTSPEGENNPDTLDAYDFMEMNKKTGVLTISGTEDFRMPYDFSLSAIKKIIIAHDVSSADLGAIDHEYQKLESIECAANCEVHISASDLIHTPFYSNNKNWSNGALYIGSSLIAINKDAPAICKLQDKLTYIDSNLSGTLLKAAPQIERFEISNKNTIYETDANGILYRVSDGDLYLELYPPSSTMKTYHVPDSLQDLSPLTSKNLKTIHLSANASLSQVDSSDTYAPALEEYIVDAGHSKLFSKDGVLFLKDTYPDETSVTLLDYPKHKRDRKYRIPDNTTSVNRNAFRYTAFLESLFIPDSVTYLDSEDGFFTNFEGCKKLARISVDHGNEHYSASKDGLLLIEDTHMVYLPGRTETEYTIPSGITRFEVYGNTHLESIHLCKDVEDINVDQCPALEAFHAKDNKHGFYTEDGVLFQNVVYEANERPYPYLIYYPAGKKDRTYTVPEGIENLYGSIEWSSDSAFHNNPYIEEIRLPEGLKSICIGAFAGCTSLKKVNLPDTLQNLGNGAFSGCTSLTEITIPAGLHALGFYDGPSSYALAGSSLKDIHFKGTRAQWDALVHADYYPAVLPDGVRIHCTDD